MIIWIVRKHPMHPYRSGHISAFTIVSTHKNRADAAAIVNKKNSNRNTYMLYTVGKVCIKENQ